MWYICDQPHQSDAAGRHCVILNRRQPGRFSIQFAALVSKIFSAGHGGSAELRHGRIQIVLFFFCKQGIKLLNCIQGLLIRYRHPRSFSTDFLHARLVSRVPRTHLPVNRLIRR